MGEPELKRMSVDEFLAWQESQDRNYELVDGLPVLPLKAMTGASKAHDTVAVNLIRELAVQLRGRPCKVRTDDIAVKVPGGNIRRPDILVECGPIDLKSTMTTEPKVVIEILSPSTMNFDRTRKVEEYKTIPSLSSILLVDTEAPRITLFVRREIGWTSEFYDTMEAAIELPEVGCRLAAADIFEGLPFAA